MSSNDPIAIIGIGCRFPGGATGPEAFWKQLCDGVDTVAEIPADRWNADASYDPRPGQEGKSISRWAGTLDSIDRFDAAFFGVSPREAELMDRPSPPVFAFSASCLDELRFTAPGSRNRLSSPSPDLAGLCSRFPIGS